MLACRSRGGHQGQRADDLAHRGEQVPLGVLVRLGDHGPVQVEQDPVHREGGLEAFEKLPLQGLVRRLLDGSRRDGEGPQQGNELDSQLRGPVDETARDGAGPGEGVEDALPGLVRPLLEALQGGGNLGKGVGLVADAAGGDAHGGASFSRSLSRWW